MKARIYIRVSTDEQAREGFSLAAQNERCLQFIESQGWDFTGEYRDDGYSAKSLDRPAMQQMIQDIKGKEFDVLVIYRLDRLVRSVVDLHTIINLMDDKGVSFKSVTEAFDTTTAMGRFFITLVGSMAQWERENLGERVKMGLERRFLEGKKLGGFAPYGYKIENGKYIVHPDESRVVKQIFDLYKNHGMNKIAKILNSQNKKTRSGSYWQDFQIHYILTNPIYMGKIRYRPGRSEEKKMLTDSNHEIIITPEKFEQVQQLMKKRKNSSPKAMTSHYAFSGILYCGKCNHPMIGGRSSPKPHTKYYYFYRCSGKRRGVCKAPNISEEKIAGALFSHLEWFINDLNTITEYEEESSSEDEKREEITREIKSIQKKRKKWQLAYAEDVITLDELRERTQEDRIQEENLQKKLLELPVKKAPALSKDEFLESLKDLSGIWKEADRYERKEIIHSLFKRLVVAKDGPGRESSVSIIDYELV